MNSTSRRRRLTAATVTALAVTVSASACSSGSGSTDTKGAGGGTYTIWDPYPQFDKGSDWTKLLDRCGTKAGVKVKRTAFDTSDLGNKTLLAAQQGNSPDVLIVDNPVVSTLAEAGVLTTTDDNKLDTSKADPNLRAAGQSGGKTYGTPPWMWSVAVDDARDVCAYNGKNSRWYQAALRQKAGRVTAAGITKDVSFEPVNGAINDLIDDAYWAKHKGSPYLSPMIGARAATIKVMPRAGHA